jgi:hypothetical protein
MPLDYEQNGYGQPDPDAADLGLTPISDPDAAPEWFMAPEPEPRYLCDADAWEWQYHAGPSADAMEEQARELATHIVLRMEIENHELRERNAAQAQELARLRELRADAADHLVAQVNEAQKETDYWTEKYYDLDRNHQRALADITMKDELIADLREGVEVVRATLRDYGYTSGTLLERLETMHREFTVLRQHVDAQSGAHFRPSPPDAAA